MDVYGFLTQEFAKYGLPGIIMAILFVILKSMHQDSMKNFDKLMDSVLNSKSEIDRLKDTIATLSESFAVHNAKCNEGIANIKTRLEAMNINKTEEMRKVELLIKEIEKINRDAEVSLRLHTSALRATIVDAEKILITIGAQDTINDIILNGLINKEEFDKYAKNKAEKKIDRIVPKEDESDDEDDDDNFIEGL